MIGGTFIHYLLVLSGMDAPQTQTTAAERRALVEYLPGRKTIVEIGVFEGFTTQLLAEESDSDATVYGVDPFYGGRLGISWGLRITSHYNKQHLVSGKLKLIRARSTEVGDQIPAMVEYVFIDGDHSLDAIAADWSFWSSRICPRGIIALHDTVLTPGRPKSAAFGSHKYFEEVISHDRRFEIVTKVDSLSILRSE